MAGRVPVVLERGDHLDLDGGRVVTDIRKKKGDFSPKSTLAIIVLIESVLKLSAFLASPFSCLMYLSVFEVEGGISLSRQSFLEELSNPSRPRTYVPALIGIQSLSLLLAPCFSSTARLLPKTKRRLWGSISIRTCLGDILTAREQYQHLLTAATRKLFRWLIEQLPLAGNTQGFYVSRPDRISRSIYILPRQKTRLCMPSLFRLVCSLCDYLLLYFTHLCGDFLALGRASLRRTKIHADHHLMEPQFAPQFFQDSFTLLHSATFRVHCVRLPALIPLLLRNRLSRFRRRLWIEQTFRRDGRYEHTYQHHGDQQHRRQESIPSTPQGWTNKGKTMFWSLLELAVNLHPVTELRPLVQTPAQRPEQFGSVGTRLLAVVRNPTVFVSDLEHDILSFLGYDLFYHILLSKSSTERLQFA
jgi:hypothetical protein